jgi:beta-galactosidase
MKLKNIFQFVFILFMCQSYVVVSGQNSRVVKNFDENWKFYLGDAKTAFETTFRDNNWNTLDLPHDWSVEGTVSEDAPSTGSGGYYPTGIGWYRKHFTATKNDLGMKNTILFDGVYMNSNVWLNGKHLGAWAYGYNSFYFDMNPYLKSGDNVIAVRVDNSKQPGSRWYSGSGIYRHVWLIKTNSMHIAQWGVYVTTPEITEKSATVSVKTTLQNSAASAGKATLLASIFDAKGKEVGQTESQVVLEPGMELTQDQKVMVSSPSLWSLESPVLYTLVSKLLVNGKEIDEVKTPFGIRSINYDVDKGFFLNGVSVKMNGVCLHHDAGCLGAAVPIKVWERRLEVLKEMGCNAIRGSHNPVAPEFLDLCDRMGFLVMDEVFDEWKIPKREFAYNKYFDEWSEKDVIAMVRRDRNHPSIVLWSAGNEIPEQKSDNGAEMLRRLQDLFHKEDPTRPVTVACDNIAADGGSAKIEFLDLLDIVGYNYVDRWHERRELFYSIDRHDHPDWKMIGTESSSAGGVRGSYSLLSRTGAISPNYNTRMIRAEQLWKFVSTRSYVIGDFMWTGIDYLGEARWPSKSSNSGVIDLCGFPKDGFYFYQSQWTEKPMIHLFPHWNWEGNEGQVIPVLAYSNCDAVELFLNGKSYGEKRLEFPRQGNSGSWASYATPPVNATTADLHLSWDVPYEPGTLKAVGKKNGEVVCTEIIETAGKPAAIRLTLEDKQITADNQDVAHVRIEIVDAKGNTVPTADNLIMYKVSGSGKLIGLENGNSSDHEPYKSSQRSVFNGLGLAIVQAGKAPGKIILTASSDGMQDAVAEIVVK